MLSNLEYIITFSALLVATIVLVVFISKKAYDKSGSLVCKNYLLSTYLYVILTFILMGIVAIAYIYFNVYKKMDEGFKNIKNKWLIILIILAFLAVYIALIIFLQKINPKKKIMLHLIWFCLILLMSLIFGAGIMIGLTNNTLFIAIILLIAITAITGFLGYKYGGKLISYNFDYYLRIALFLLIGIGFAGVLLIKNANTMSKFRYVLTVFSLIIFVLLMFSYNNKIRKNSKTCNINTKPPNYPAEAFGLVIKMLNVLMDLLSLLEKTRR